MSAKSLTDLVGADVMQYPSELPAYDVNPTLDTLILTGISAVRSSLANLIKDDVRPYFLTLHLINVIPDKEWRFKTIEKFNSTLHEYNLTDFSSAKAVAACIEVIGCVTDWCIQYRGGNVKNVGLGGL